MNTNIMNKYLVLEEAAYIETIFASLVANIEKVVDLLLLY